MTNEEREYLESRDWTTVGGGNLMRHHDLPSFRQESDALAIQRYADKAAADAVGNTLRRVGEEFERYWARAYPTAAQSELSLMRDIVAEILLMAAKEDA